MFYCTSHDPNYVLNIANGYQNEGRHSACIYHAVHSGHLTDAELNLHISTIELLNHKCVKCNITPVLYRHKECRKCHMNVHRVNEHGFFVQYYIYAQIPCFCLDCLDYYGMSVNMHKDNKNNMILNENKNLNELNNTKEELNNTIYDLKNTVNNKNSEINTMNSQIKTLKKNHEKEKEGLKNINKDTTEKMNRYKNELEKQQKNIETYKKYMQCLKNDNFFD